MVGDRVECFRLTSAHPLGEITDAFADGVAATTVAFDFEVYEVGASVVHCSSLSSEFLEGSLES